MKTDRKDLERRNQYWWVKQLRRHPEGLIGEELLRRWGLGRAKLRQVLRKAGVCHRTKVGQLSLFQRARLKRLVRRRGSVGRVGKRTELKRRKQQEQAGTRKRYRRGQGQPVRGQRTHTNGKNARRLNRQRLSGGGGRGGGRGYRGGGRGKWGGRGGGGGRR